VTRWESCVDSVAVLRYQTDEIHDALIDISENLNDAQACSEAQSLADAILDYSFIVSVVFWYDILFRVNKISKTLQWEDADLSVAIKMLSSVIKWLTEYCQKGLASAMVDAREIAEKIGIDPVFKAEERRLNMVRHKMKQFQIHRKLCHHAIVSINERFQQLKIHLVFFGTFPSSHSLR